jgi:hypothetical protein
MIPLASCPCGSLKLISQVRLLWSVLTVKCLPNLGFTNYHRAFIEEYTQMAFPLQALTGKRTYQWGDEQERAFGESRKAMVRAPVLALPNATDPFILDTDASDKSFHIELTKFF